MLAGMKELHVIAEVIGSWSRNIEVAKATRIVTMITRVDAQRLNVGGQRLEHMNVAGAGASVKIDGPTINPTRRKDQELEVMTVECGRVLLSWLGWFGILRQ